MNEIYVQIASFRDKDLVATIRNCFAKAKNPELITIGICWQTFDEDSLEEFESDSRLKVYKCKWEVAKGCCWARSIVNDMYSGEEYTLQIDSHTRFAQNWDEILIQYFKDTNDDKAIFSGYPPSFEINEKGEDVIHQWGLEDGLLGIKTLEPSRHLTYNKLPTRKDRATKARFLAAGFVFAKGTLITDVPYDPLHYYLGEEIAYAVRAFTHGYNLYTPIRIPIYHLYFGHIDEKKGNHGLRIRTHDHVAQDIALQRLKSLVVDRNFSGLGKYGPGTVRTVEDYERYSGVDFKTRKIHSDARTGKEPDPITCENFDWKMKFIWGIFDYSKLFARLKPNLVGCHVTICEDDVEIFWRYFEVKDRNSFFMSKKLKVYCNVEKFSKLTILPLYSTGFGERVEESLPLKKWDSVDEVPAHEQHNFKVHNDRLNYVIGV